MSDGNNKKELRTNCENKERCYEMIQAVLDGSASDEELKHFKSNIEVCLPCIENYELEKSIKEVLQLKLEKRCCPEKTIDRIKASIGFAVLVAVFGITQITLMTIIF